MAAEPGFEPGLHDSESCVIPLHHSAPNNLLLALTPDSAVMLKSLALANHHRQHMVAHTGFEPVVSALRGRCPWPLDECA